MPPLSVKNRIRELLDHPYMSKQDKLDQLNNLISYSFSNKVSASKNFKSVMALCNEVLTANGDFIPNRIKDKMLDYLHRAYISALYYSIESNDVKNVTKYVLK
jgi:hypothetical protein